MLYSKTAIGLVLARFFEPELRGWLGLMPLWEVFWLRGVLASAAIAVFYIISLTDHRLAWQQVFLAFFAGHSVWALTSVWRCAANAAPMWGAVARCLTIAWASNAVLLVAFLEFDWLLAKLRS